MIKSEDTIKNVQQGTVSSSMSNFMLSTSSAHSGKWSDSKTSVVRDGLYFNFSSPHKHSISCLCDTCVTKTLKMQPFFLQFVQPISNRIITGQNFLKDSIIISTYESFPLLNFNQLPLIKQHNPANCFYRLHTL